MKRTFEELKKFYFPSHWVSPSFIHGFLGFIGAVIGSKGALFLGITTPLLTLFFVIGAYLFISTIFATVVKVASMIV